jgi:hypothetical protein
MLPCMAKKDSLDVTGLKDFEIILDYLC